MSFQVPATPPSTGTVPSGNLTARRIGALGAISAPWVIFVLQLVLLPSYLLPMFYHPIVGPIVTGILVVGLGVSALVWFFLQRSRRPLVWVFLIYRGTADVLGSLSWVAWTRNRDLPGGRSYHGWQRTGIQFFFFFFFFFFRRAISY